jgi:DNA-binding transcriptional MerR regulator
VKDGLTVGSVASAAGVTPDAVRYYERLRLLSKAPRTSSGYRIFETADIDRVRAIRRAQALGMTLVEIGSLFPQGGLGRAECRRVRSLLAEKIADADARIAELREFRRGLQSYLAACDRAILGRGDVPCPVFAPHATSNGSRQIGRRKA